MMAVELIVKGYYYGCADALFERARHFSDLIDATRRISTYHHLPAVPMEEGCTYQTDISVFGLFKCRGYQITVDRISPEARTLDTVEFGDSIRTWRHRLHIGQTHNGAVWTDRISIDAGLMTPVMARYAKYMYQERHKFRQAEVIEARISKACRPMTPELPVFQPAE